MNGSARTAFLTRDEALEAIRIDLCSYGPQSELLCGLLGALGGGRALAAQREGVPGLFLARDGAAGEFLAYEAARGRFLELLATRRPSLEDLAALCALVFGGNADVAPDPDGGPDGVLLETGMEGFACTRCGRCCLDLDFHLECTEGDVALWRERVRDDVLAWVGVEEGPRGPEYRIWKRPGTPLYAESCPFLRRVPGDTAFVCAIHDVKPAVCRSYPGLRKHALLTGCRGFPSPEPDPET